MVFPPYNSIDSYLWDLLPDKRGQKPNSLRNSLVLNSPLELAGRTLVP